MTDYELYKAEQEALSPPPNMTVAEWVEAHRILSKGSAEPGPKRISRTPAVAIVYDWFGDPSIREATIQKPAQCGLTDAVVDLILWISENDPSPTALFFADQDTARKLMKFRIVPALEALGKVRVSKDNRDKDVTKFECSLTNGFYLMVSWGSSIAQTASMSFKYVFCDEINKPGYDANKEEGNSLGRIRERMETYPDSKFFKFSTPTLDAGRVTKEITLADVIHDLQVPCKSCGGFQILSFKNVVWEGGSAATREQIEETARYKCEHCGDLWTTTDKNLALEHGRFVPRIDCHKPKHVGLQIHRLCSLFKGGRLPEMVKRWIDANNEGPKEIQNVVNSIFGEPWVQRISAPQGDTIERLKSCVVESPRATPPADCLCLTAGIDVQQNGMYYRIRAWNADTTSTGIDEGFVSSWEELEGIIYSEYAGRRIWRALIDTGGGKEEGALVSRTEETYNFIRKNQGRGVQLMGAKGSSRSMPGKIKIGAAIERTPSGKPIPGGIRLVQINTEAFKNAIWWRIERTESSEPGAFYLHNETPDWYYKHMTAEEKRVDREGAVSWVAIRKDNHILDCEVLAVACIDPEFWGGIRTLQASAARRQVLSARRQSKPKGPNPYLEGF